MYIEFVNKNKPNKNKVTLTLPCSNEKFNKEVASIKGDAIDPFFASKGVESSPDAIYMEAFVFGIKVYSKALNVSVASKLNYLANYLNKEKDNVKFRNHLISILKYLTKNFDTCYEAIVDCYNEEIGNKITLEIPKKFKLFRVDDTLNYLNRKTDLEWKVLDEENGIVEGDSYGYFEEGCEVVVHKSSIPGDNIVVNAYLTFDPRVVKLTEKCNIEIGKTFRCEVSNIKDAVTLIKEIVDMDGLLRG